MFNIVISFPGYNRNLKLTQGTVPCIYPCFLTNLSFNINTFTSPTTVFYLLRFLHYLMALNPNNSGHRGPDSYNQLPTTGQFNFLPCPFQDSRQVIQPTSFNPTIPHSHNPTIPVVPQPMGTTNATQLNQFPFLALPNGFPMGFPHTVPGLVPGGNLLQSREYPVPNNSHPVHGESHINNIPQGENSYENSHNSSSWSSGFTNVLQDLSLDHSMARTPSHHTQDNKVSHNLNFQQIYANSRDVMQTI